MEIVTVKEKIKETPGITTIKFSSNFTTYPFAGQFLMVWIPEFGEKPYTFSRIPYPEGEENDDSNQNGEANENDDRAFWISIMDVGKFSHKFSSLDVGDRFGIRGPYGNGFDIDLKCDSVIIVGGGVGIAPVACAADWISKRQGNIGIISFIGATTADELLFSERLSKIGEVFEATDDGSQGCCGYVTEALKQNLPGILNKNKNIEILACGPQPMLLETARLAEKYEIPIQVSLDRYMKCGIGLCGSCAIGDKLVCRDGPVFKGSDIANYGL